MSSTNFLRISSSLIVNLDRDSGESIIIIAVNRAQNDLTCFLFFNLLMLLLCKIHRRGSDWESVHEFRTLGSMKDVYYII